MGGGWTIGGYQTDYKNQISGNMMCANDNGEDSCQGDSGGPLVIRSRTGDVQVGVVSWGVGCAHRDFPGVYARVSAQYHWIRANVCEGSSDPPASFECKQTMTGSQTHDLLVEEDQDLSAEGSSTIPTFSPTDPTD